MLCSKTCDVSNMREAAIKSHALESKHKEHTNMSTSDCAGIGHFFVIDAQQRQQHCVPIHIK